MPFLWHTTKMCVIMCVYVCTYVYECVCENACVRACACVYVCICMCMCMCTRRILLSYGRNKVRLMHVQATVGTSATKQVYTKALVYYFFQASHRVTCPSGGNQPQGMRTLLVLPYTTVFLFSLFLLFLLVFSLSFTFSAFGLL